MKRLEDCDVKVCMLDSDVLAKALSAGQEAEISVPVDPDSDTLVVLNKVISFVFSLFSLGNDAMRHFGGAEQGCGFLFS